MDDAAAGIPYLARALPQIVLIADVDGAVHFANERWTEHTGRPPGTARGAGWLAAVHPEDQDRVRQAWERAVAEDRDHVVEARLEQAAGGYRRYRLRTLPDLERGADPLRWYLLAEPQDDGAQPTGFVAAATGAADREDPERAGEASERHLRNVLDNLIAFVAVLEPDGTVVEVNEAPLRLAGIGLADVEGRKFWDGFWWNDDPDLQARIREACRRAAEGEVVRFDTSLRVAGGGRLPVDFQVAPLRDERGEITHLVPSAVDISARVAADAERRRQGESFRRALVEAPFPILLHAEDGRILQVSRAFTDLTGYALGDVPTIADWTRRAYGEAHAAVEADIDRLFALDRRTDEGEYVVRTASGEARTWTFSSAPVGWTPGGRRLVVSMAADVTDQVEAREALRESEARYRTLFEAIGEGFCLIEVLFDEDDRPVDYRFLEVNPAFEQHTGLVDAVGKTARELAPDLEAHRVATYGRVATTGEPAHFVEASVVRERWFEVNAFRAGAPGDRRVALLFNDITERKKAEDALRALNQTLEERVEAQTAVLREREQFLNTIFEGSAAASFVVDVEPAGTFRYAGYNPTAAEITGVPAEAIVGRTVEDVADLFGEAAVAAIRANYRRCVEAGEPVRYEEELPAAGGPTWWLTQLTPLRGEGGRVDRIIGTAVNIDDRRRAEEAVQELNGRLRERAEELEEANRRLQEFTYSVSHDLRAPLRAISGFAEILERRYADALDERGRRYVHNVVAASARMGRLIDDLLHYSRLGRSGVVLGPVDLREALEAALAPLQPLVRETRAEISLPGGTARVQAAETLIDLALTNVLTNALTYYKPDERPRVRVEVERVDGSSGGRVRVHVHDEGIGIEPAHHDKVFQLFQRLHAMQDYPGTGLGLAIVRRAMSLMNGAVTLASRPGGGSTFTLHFDAAD